MTRRGGRPRKVALPERCGSSAAETLRTAGLKLKPGGRLEIDAGAVERMSAVTAVAVLSLARTAAEIEAAAVIRRPTRAFTDAFADLGLFEPLMSMEFAE